MAPNSESVVQSEVLPEMHEVELDPHERNLLVTKKATCPFLGSAVATGKLPVRNHPEDPLASIQDVIDLGNTGGGNLGIVLGFFARGNHDKRRGAMGKLDTLIPPRLGLFSLDLPGSQGSHPGHSGILQGDPTQLNSGRFSQADFDRFMKVSPDNEFIRLSDVARFIAENIDRDPNSKLLPIAKWGREAADLSQAVLQRLDNSTRDDTMDNEIAQSFASILGGNHLLGSAGEFGLLLAFLHNSPRTRREDGNPAFSKADITAMFKDKKLPEGWETWEKSARDWLFYTFKLEGSAAHELTERRGGFRGILDRIFRI